MLMQSFRGRKYWEVHQVGQYFRSCFSVRTLLFSVSLDASLMRTKASFSCTVW